MKFSVHPVLFSDTVTLVALTTAMTVSAAKGERPRAAPRPAPWLTTAGAFEVSQIGRSRPRVSLLVSRALAARVAGERRWSLGGVHAAKTGTSLAMRLSPAC